MTEKSEQQLFAITTKPETLPNQTRRPLKKLYPVELKSKKTEQTEFPIKFIEHAKIENN